MVANDRSILKSENAVHELTFTMKGNTYQVNYQHEDGITWPRLSGSLTRPIDRFAIHEEKLLPWNLDAATVKNGIDTGHRLTAESSRAKFVRVLKDLHLTLFSQGKS